MTASIAMQEELAATEGIFAELSSVMPLLAIEKLRAEGTIAAGDTVVAVVTASGLKDLDRSTNDRGVIARRRRDASTA